MSIDRVVAGVSAAAVSLVFLVGGALMILDQGALLEAARQREIDRTAVVFKMAMDQAATLSATHAEGLAADRTVQEALRTGDRAGLLALEKPALERLERLAGLDVMHFHDASMRSFLRVWDPGNFGQDLSTFRPMVVAANRHLKTQKGLEVGIRGLSLRAVAPVVDAGRLVGTVETGVNLQALADLAKTATGSDYAIILDRRALKEAPKDAATAGASLLVMDATTDKGLFEGVLGEGQVALSPDSATFQFTRDGNNLTIFGTPLLDYSGTMIGVVLTATDFSELETHYNRTFVTTAALSVAGFLVIFAFIMTMVRATVTRPLRDLTKRLSDGDAPPDEASTGLADFARLQQSILIALRRRAPRDGQTNTR